MKLLPLLVCGLLSACAGLPAIPGLPAADATPTETPAFAAARAGGAEAIQIGVLRSGLSSILFLDTFRDGVGTWISSDGVSIAMRDGMMIATRGLGGDLLGSDVTEPFVAITSGQPGQVTRFHTFLDGENRAVRRAYVCDITARGDRQITLGDRDVPVRLLGEDCVNPEQQFLNLYWIDNTGRILQSRQWAGDFAGVLTFRIVP